MLLNALLAVLAGVVVWRLKAGYEEELGRERAFLEKKTAQPAPPVVVIPPVPAQASAANFLEIATKLLFSRDRNPNVVVEEVKVPPPPPMPPLPAYFGMVRFGGEPKVILSVNGGTQKSYLAGDGVGDFKLVAIEEEGLEFDWNGKTVKATYAELRQKPVAAPEPVQKAAAAAPVAAKNEIKTADGVKPAFLDTSDAKPCESGDKSPSGTERDGYRKVVSNMPFGNPCQWVRVQ